MLRGFCDEMLTGGEVWILRGFCVEKILIGGVVWILRGFCDEILIDGYCWE